MNAGPAQWIVDLTCHGDIWPTTPKSLSHDFLLGLSCWRGAGAWEFVKLACQHHVLIISIQDDGFTQNERSFFVSVKN